MLPDSDDLIGTMLGKDYRVLQQIGAGGMAVVYLVEHQTLLKRFAAKVLSPALASSLEARARFAQEAHAASQLDHENIVSISDFGVTADHRPFFVMELLRGQTLDQRLAEGPMSIEEVVAVCVPVASALAHAHAEGVIHLDVKPENIFLVQRSQGRWGVKVVDFGIAKTPLDPRISNPGETVGSPMFMAPEVCRGDEIDQRADIYSFGILLYLMMCGRLPFVDDSLVRVLQMQLVELPAPPREVNAQLSPELAAIVERSLAKQPDDRYPSMGALLRDLDAALPPGADRLLIESQSGRPASDTPFPRALSVERHESQRPPRPSHPVPPSGVVSSQPEAPARRGRGLLIPGLVVAIAGVSGLVWWQLDARRRAVASAHEAPGATIASIAEAGPPSAEPPASAKPAATAPGSSPRGDAEPADVSKTIVDTTSAAELAATDVVPPSDLAQPAASAAASAEGPRATPLGRSAASTVAKKLPTRVRPAVRPGQIPTARRTPTPAASPTVARTGQGALHVASAPLPVAPPGEPPAEAHPAPGAIDVARPPAELAPVVTAPPAAPTAAPSVIPTIAPPPPLPPPPPAPPAPEARPSPGTLDAVPAITSLDVKGSLSPALVRRSVERTLSLLRACYRTSARATASTPPIDLQLTFEIDETGRATEVSAAGLRFGTLGACSTDVARKIRTQEAPDVGTAQVTVGIRFRPS